MENVSGRDERERETKKKKEKEKEKRKEKTKRQKEEKKKRKNKKPGWNWTRKSASFIWDKKRDKRKWTERIWNAWKTTTSVFGKLFLLSTTLFLFSFAHFFCFAWHFFVLSVASVSMEPKPVQRKLARSSFPSVDVLSHFLLFLSDKEIWTRWIFVLICGIPSSQSSARFTCLWCCWPKCCCPCDSSSSSHCLAWFLHPFYYL